MKKILQKLLARRARAIIETYQPEVIGITGSVGKTSTKEAISTVLSTCFHVRASYKNYNNELGVPLTIIGLESPGRSIRGWHHVLAHAKQLTTRPDPDYPRMLVLEMGIDHPGDMQYLVDMAPPSRAVITRLGTAHLEFFPSREALHQEKLRLAEAVSGEGMVIYNYEDEKLRQAVQALSVKIWGYGFTEGADIRAEHLSFNFSGLPENRGVTFKLVSAGSVVPVFIPGVVSRPAVLAALAGAAVGLSYDMNALEISQALKNFQTPPGRMKLLEGIRQTLIIDDSYNASPEAVRESLDTVLTIPRADYHAGWLVLGDMRELGKDSETAHEKIGELCAASGVDYLVTVGTSAAAIGQAAIKEGMEQTRVWHFSNASAAADFLENTIREKDLLLVKGSQAVRLEKIVKRLLADQTQAATLLVRQGPEWQTT